MLLSPTTYTPSWVVKGSLSRFIQLRAKLKEVMYAKNEMDKFIQSKNPDDNQFMVAYKQAGKKQTSYKVNCNLHAMHWNI